MLRDNAGGQPQPLGDTMCGSESSSVRDTPRLCHADGVAVLTSKTQGLRAAGLFSDESGTNILAPGAPYYDSYCCVDGKYLAVRTVEPEVLPGIEITSRLGVDTSNWLRRITALRQVISGVLAAHSVMDGRRSTPTVAPKFPLHTASQQTPVDVLNVLSGLDGQHDATTPVRTY